MVADALSVLACGTGRGIDMGNSGIYRKRRSSRNPDRRRTSRPVERDPSKADDSIPGSDPVPGKSSRLADSWNLGELSGFTGGWLVGKVGHLAGEYLVSGVPETLLSLIFVLAALGGSHHVQARGRLAQISWGVAAWLGGILLLLAAVQNSPSLEMVWGDQHLETTGFDWKRSVKSIGKYVAYGSGIGLMTWLTVQVRDSKEKRRKEGLAPAIGQLSLWFLTGAVLLTVNFGTDATTMNTCPILEVMAGVELPGGFLRRVDLIFLSILLFSLVFLLGSIFFYSSYVADRIHISIGRLPSAILCFLLGTTAQKQWNWSRQYPRMLSRVYLPVCLMMTVCAAWARRKSYGKR